MRTEQQMTTIVTRATKDLHLTLARKWGFPAAVFSGATLGLGVTMLVESGYTEAEIVGFVRQLVADMAPPPSGRGAS